MLTHCYIISCFFQSTPVIYRSFYCFINIRHLFTGKIVLSAVSGQGERNVAGCLKQNGFCMIFICHFVFLASDLMSSAVLARHNAKAKHTQPPATKPQVMLSCFLPLPAKLGFILPSVFLQGLQENVDGLEDEGNPVSKSWFKCLFLVLSSSSLFSYNILSLYIFSFRVT